jgi:DNA ligase (NAD+)
VADFHSRLDESRDDLEYEIDGVVIKVDDLQLRERLGTRQRSPRWAFALKFPPKQEVTILEKIVVQADLRQLEGFAEKSARQLHEAIQKSKKPRLDRFLYALGIRHVGQRTAQILAEQFRTLDALKEADAEDLERISDIGPEIARSVADFFAREKNRAVLDRLADSGVKVQARPAGEKAQPLQGKTFVFTGSLADYSRREAKRAVEDRGGRATSSVSGQTDYLVVGENPGGKLDEAEAQDVEILDENGFKERIGD